MEGARRKKQSNCGIRLGKQKAKYTYIILEKRFRILLNACTEKGITGVVLLQLIESRLDNVVYLWALLHTKRCPSTCEPLPHREWRRGNIPSRLKKVILLAYAKDRSEVVVNSQGTQQSLRLEWDGENWPENSSTTPQKISPKISETLSSWSSTPNK